MIAPKEIRRDILSLLLLSLGGLLLHLKLHPIPIDPDNPQNPANLVPFVFCLLGAVAVPVLLGRKKTFLAGYLINGIGVIVGTIIMAHMSFASPPRPLTAGGVLLRSSLPYILLLLPKLLIGHSVLLHYHPRGMGRMFTLSWWLRHFCYLTGVYVLGHFLWS
jgi:hypothetical protein